MKTIEEYLAEVKRLQEERKKISAQILSLMNKARYMQKHGESEKGITLSEKMFGKAYKDLTKEELTAYHTQRQQARRTKMKGGNTNGNKQETDAM